MTATEYELLTQRLMRLIAERSPLQTTRLEHDITLTGRGGPNQIDVIWEFLTPDGSPRRVIVECRKYRSPLKRQAVFAWREVVDDLDSPDMPRSSPNSRVPSDHNTTTTETCPQTDNATPSADHQHERLVEGGL
jgi:hypothetical protein